MFVRPEEDYMLEHAIIFSKDQADVFNASLMWRSRQVFYLSRIVSEGSKGYEGKVFFFSLASWNGRELSPQ